MKQINKVWFLLAGIVAISCVKQEETVPEAQEYVTIQASLDASATKTYLDGVQVKWEADDEIALWYGILNTSMDDELYTVASIDGGDARQATFHGFAPAGAWDAYMGVYPYSACDGCSKEGKLTVTLPSVQTAEADGFAPGSNVAVAYSATTDLTFQNVGALLAVQITDVGGHMVTSLRLTGTSALSGQVEIEQATLPAVDAVVAGEDYVELTGTIAAGNTYYFVVLPGSHTGFTLTLTDSEGYTATASSTHTFEITRNSNTLIANLTVDEGNWVAPPVVIEEKVVLNEVNGNGQKFIELYNAGETAMSLSGWTVQKDETVVWTGTTESIAAGEYMVLYSNKNKGADANPEGAVTFTGGLSAKKNVKVDLYNASSVLKDSFARGIKGAGWGEITLTENTENSFSRVPNGTGGWVYAVATVGATNGAKVSCIDHGLVLNEVNGNDKFIELRNTSNASFPLEGLTIQKDGKLVWTGQSGYSIEPGGYVLLYSTDVTGAGKAHEGYDAGLQFDSGLSAKKAVRVQLFSTGGSSLDDFNYVTYSGTPAPASYGRNADGVWYYQAATPGAVNTDGENIVTGLE